MPGANGSHPLQQQQKKWRKVSAVFSTYFPGDSTDNDDNDGNDDSNGNDDNDGYNNNNNDGNDNDTSEPWLDLHLGVFHHKPNSLQGNLFQSTSSLHCPDDGQPRWLSLIKWHGKWVELF